MQADSSATAEFSLKLYEQLRFDDVWNNKRLAWYITASQALANRSVIEKIWMLVHATQIFGILWTNMCQGEVRWPSDFCSQASFLRYSILDVPSMISWTALSSSSPGPHMRHSNSLLWWFLFLFPSGSFVCYQWAVALHRRCTRRVNKMPFLHRVTLTLTSLFYVPIAFVQVRHVTCSSYNLIPAPVLFEGCPDMCRCPPTPPLALLIRCFLAVRRFLDAYWCSSRCGSDSAAGHLALTVWSCFALLLIALAIPLQYSHILRGCIVSNNPKMHEHNVKASELELITGLSWNYVRRYYYIVASYNRPWAYFTVWMQLLSLAWILLTCLTMHSAALTLMRALLLLIPLLLWGVGIAVRRPYRLFTSNVALVCTVVALSLDCVTFTLLASRDKSPFSKLSVMEPFLQFLNIAWPCIIILACVCSFSPLQQLLPQKWVRWPVRLDSYHDAAGIVDTLAADRDTFSRFYSRTPEFVNPELLKPHIRGLDSLFRSLHTQRHPMSLAVENSLEDWMGLYNSVRKVSLLPYPPLERELPQLRLRCDARDDYLLLLPRRMKMILLKLFALRMFIELLHARRALGPKHNARLRHAHPAVTALVVLPQPQLQPPPPAEAHPSTWMNATGFLAREANRAAWRRRNSHLLYQRVEHVDVEDGGV